MQSQRNVMGPSRGRRLRAAAILIGLVSFGCSSGDGAIFDPGNGLGGGGGGGGGGGLEGGMLTVEPLTDFMVTGFEAGPFSPSSRSYTLSNTGTAAFTWNASLVATWLEFSGPTAGILLPGETAQVLVDVAEFADLLMEGTYSGTIEFRNTTDGAGDSTAYAQLDVLAGDSQESLLVVAPLEDLDSSGPEGGPFTPADKTYSLTNLGAQALDWNVALSQSWLSAAGATSGTLNPGESADVVIGIGADALSLAPGSYLASIDFTNATDGNGDSTVSAHLDVLGPGILAVAPAEDFQSAGPPGGPFSPATRTYTLSNTGQQGLAWAADVSEPWLAVDGASTGTLAAGESVAVSVRITGTANTLPVGSYTGTIGLANTTSGDGGATLGATLDVLGSGVLAVSPLEDFDSSGPQGGPFDPAEKTYTLSNIGTEALDWSVTEAESWLAVSGAASGTLLPGESTDVLLQIGGDASSLSTGSYAGLVDFTNATNGNGSRSTAASLDVLVPGALSVTPNEDFISSGPPGGPFTPASRTYTLSNTGEQTIAWSASTTGSWFSISGATSGTLTGGQTAFVTMQVAGSAGTLPAGTYPGTISFTNQTNGAGTVGLNARLDVVGAGALTVAPAEDFTSSGPQGGPFTPSSKTYTLSNVGTQALTWSAGVTGSWLAVSGASSGTLNTGQSTNVVIQVGASASSLAVGTYPGTIGFVNQTNGNGDATFGAQLDVTGAGVLTVAPAEDFDSVGPEGGPFTPASKTYTLSNTGAQALDWSVGVTGSWLGVSGSSSGSLNPGQSTNVLVQVTAAATSLSGGSYPGSISFSNLTNGDGDTTQGATLAVTVGGWTDLSPSPDSRLVYVSSSLGNDANDGLSEATPKATIIAGYGLLRNGFPDWLQLRQGDEFPLYSGLNLQKSGRSATEPQVITSYGTANTRPIVYTRGATAIGMSQVSSIAIAHIEFDPTDGVATFRPDGSNPRGVFIFESCSDILLEGCLFTNYAIVVECGPLNPSLANSNIAFRRNVVDSTYGLGGGAGFGILTGKTNNILIEENILDRCGNNDQDSRATQPTGGQHAIYLQSDVGGTCVVRGNIITRPASAGAQCRAGGIVEDNFVTRTAGALRIGGSGESNSPSGYVQATVQRNVLLDGYDYGSNQFITTGMWIQNADGVVVRQNILANTPESPFGNGKAIWLSPDDSFGNRAVRIEENVVYNWGNLPIALTSHTGQDATGWRFINNDIQTLYSPGNELLYANSTTESSAIVECRDNRYWSAAPQASWFQVATSTYSVTQFNALVGDTTSTASQVSYPDPTRDVGDYMASLGTGSTLQDFIDEALLQSKHNWRLEYTTGPLNNFIRAGFGLPPF